MEHLLSCICPPGEKYQQSFSQNEALGLSLIRRLPADAIPLCIPKHESTILKQTFVAFVSWVMVGGMKGGTIIVALTFCKRLPSHSSQEQAFTRITGLFVCLGITMLKMA